MRKEGGLRPKPRAAPCKEQVEKQEPGGRGHPSSIGGREASRRRGSQRAFSPQTAEKSLSLSLSLCHCLCLSPPNIQQMTPSTTRSGVFSHPWQGRDIMSQWRKSPPKSLLFYLVTVSFLYPAGATHRQQSQYLLYWSTRHFIHYYF